MYKILESPLLRGALFWIKLIGKLILLALPVSFVTTWLVYHTTLTTAFVFHVISLIVIQRIVNKYIDWFNK